MTKRPFMFAVFSTAILASVPSLAQICTSADQRPALEQLDCFCSPTGNSVIEKKVGGLEFLAEALHLNLTMTCASALSNLLVAHPNTSVSDDVSKQFIAIGFDNNQSAIILQEAKNRASFINSILSSENMAPAQFEPNSNVESRQIQRRKRMELAKLANEIRQNSQRFSSSPFYSLYSKLERVVEIASSYPSQRISQCLETTEDLAKIGICLDSKSTQEKVRGCHQSSETSIGLECQNSGSTSTIAQACSALNMTESYTRMCASSGATADVISACGALNMTSPNTILCFMSRVASSVIQACGEIELAISNKMSCVQSRASAQKIRDCGRQSSTRSATLNCILN